jgi:hypothetical protein
VLVARINEYPTLHLIMLSLLADTRSAVALPALASEYT